MARNVKGCAVAGAVALGLAGAVVAPPAPAHASYPTCNGVYAVDTVSLEQISFPINVAADPWTNCILRKNDTVHELDYAVSVLSLSLWVCYPELRGEIPNLVPRGPVYNDDTEKAVKYVQQHYLHFSEGDIDGVYSPATAREMQHVRLKTLPIEDLKEKVLELDPANNCRFMKDDELKQNR